MSIDFGLLKIREVIVHEVPKVFRRETNPAPLRLSQVSSPLTPEVLKNLQVKFRGDLAHSGREIVEDSPRSSKVPDIVRDYLDGDESDFVLVSQDLAEALRASQDGANSGGLLLVASASIAEKRALLIVKLANENGMRATFDSVNGKDTFQVVYLNDLLFAGKAQVYKAGLFLQPQDDEHALEGFVSDKQTPGSRIAGFFLQDYLGCRPKEQPEELTLRFFESSGKWIDSFSTSSEKQTRYTVALLSELQSNRRSISMRGFANSHLDEEDRDAYVHLMSESGVPKTPFEKDLYLVESKLAKIQYTFDSGTVVIVPPSALTEGIVHVVDDDDGLSRIEVLDHLKEMKSRGSGGRRSNRPRDLESSDGSGPE
ncbi:nucleoid-associated protein [Streptomyces spinosisporus]|uniref:Nucleoid-associated protein n=1 Tax=Streptomyces spinosisporus TaxID=2927582 RepID=A0ABS9XQH2_9ACTN|nr:nucleoid-associated protein [Streptomyces spinosisporus]MCI3243162.1 nucleoid-associated protein [Streptomyces spinosisporus]